MKASLEVKAEIPKEETGRLVAALTDIIRPFTEIRGLKADQIRLQREDVLFSIAKRARERAALEKIELHPVPTKMLVPFLEKASLEDVDKEMQDRWAALLLSASKEYQDTHLTFIDILSRLSSRELKLLEEVCFLYESFPERSYPNGHYERNGEILESNAKLLVVEEPKPEPEVKNSMLHIHLICARQKKRMRNSLTPPSYRTVRLCMWECPIATVARAGFIKKALEHLVLAPSKSLRESGLSILSD